MSSITKNAFSSIEAVSGDGKNRVRVDFLRFALPSKWLLALLAIPMLVALGISAYLTYVSVTASEIVGCSGGQLFDCSHVIYSKWSKLMSIPVSSMALGTYVAMIVATIVVASNRFSNSVRQMAWVAVTGLAIAAALAALYFMFLQVFVLKHLCPWCMGAHACGLLIATAILCRNRIAVPQLATVSGFAAAGLAVMIGLQVTSEEPPKFIMTEYEPVVVPKDDAGNENGTYVVSPRDLENAPTDDDGTMLPPDEDDLFAPPSDDEDLFEPPSEDTEDDDDGPTEAETVSATLDRAVGVVANLGTQFVAMRYPQFAGMLIQESATQQAQEEQESEDNDDDENETDQATDSSQDKAEVAKKKVKRQKPEPRIVEFMGKKLNAHQWPVDGNPTAKYVFVEMFDYTCSHCRTTSRAVFQAKAKLGDDLAVVVLPVPMNTKCNATVTRDHADHVQACELSMLAVAVWRCDAKKFSEFHKWMFEGVAAPDYQTALRKAGELVGKDRIEKEMNKKTAGAYVQRHVQMYKMLGTGAVPKLLFPTRSIQGEFTAADTLEQMIKQQAQQ